MKWIKVTHDFGVPFCVLTLNSRDAAVYRRTRGILTLTHDDPNRLEEEITKLIAELRPELAGGQLIGMDMSGYMQFRFHYYHPKLSRVMNYSQPPEIPLLVQPNEPVTHEPDALTQFHEDNPHAYVEAPYELRHREVKDE
jgi:hypothetical protein